MRPFDAVLLIAFGGPGGPADVRPFLARVLRGRAVPADRVEEVARHYEHFGGKSPLTEVTQRQAVGLGQRLRARGCALPVYVGMRNWHPLLPDTLQAMADAGVRRAIGVILAPHRSYSSCLQYRENVRDARRELRASGRPDIDIVYVGDWHDHPDFIAAHADRVGRAAERLPRHLRPQARLIFSAHSLPRRAAASYPYQQQIESSARLVAARAGFEDWAVVYQSRSGRPEEAWLEPDVCDYLRAARAEGLEAAVLCPIGFVSDNIEILYDLDVEAAAVARAIGLELVRAEPPNDDPRFLDMLADVVRRTWAAYARGRPLAVDTAEAGASAVRRA
ncbi:MAG TPA: ferrochelatase [Vicinamibacterales bacterium]|nr:ferrochelatase [Vicinamibacterales bacterium]